MEALRKRIMEVQKRIDQAAHRSGRTGQDITLVAVSKTVDIDTARMAYEIGLRDFGENRTQELNRKQEAVPSARWHMIGRLQTNKVKDIVGKTCLIHSMDSWHLAEAIDKRGEFLQMEVPVLLQVNISGEEQKAGVDQLDVEQFLASAGELNWIRICGFMTMAPLHFTGEESRPVFAELADLNARMKKRDFQQVDLQYLSMGMSQDYETAIEEGANIVRIGSAIFA